ncbi:MAG: putative glycosyl transferase [Candidatus Thorarchaeota archaeon]|nr:MAG: putative glycosyl transferase [Candidatus Thorarchaeota archaeon]
MFPPIQSGSSHYAERLAEGLAQRGHDVYVITSSGAEISDMNDYRVIEIPSITTPTTPMTHNYALPFNFFPLNIPLLRNIIKKISPDIVHLNSNFLDLCLGAMIAAKGLGIATVLTVHTRLIHANKFLNPFFRAVDKSLIKQILHKVDAFVALDKQMYNYILNTYDLSKDKIHPIPLAIDLDELLSTPTKPTLLDTLESQNIIASISHLTLLKSPRTLLEAVSIIKDDFEDLIVAFAGRVCDTRFVNWAKELDVSEHVVFMGEIPHHLIPSVLKRSCIEAHSLDYRTGFDNASIEAMSLGLPVISCVPEDNFLREWLHNWENVILVEPYSPNMVAEALYRLLSNQELMQNISKNAGRSAKQFFSIERMLDDFEQLYANLVGDLNQ